VTICGDRGDQLDRARDMRHLRNRRIDGSRPVYTVRRFPKVDILYRTRLSSELLVVEQPCELIGCPVEVIRAGHKSRLADLTVSVKV
jgi:hypothetical protein